MVFLTLVAFYGFFCLSVLLLRWVDPITTAVQIQRRVEALVRGKKYRKRYTFVPLAGISHELQHAVIAAEDGRFYEHHGVDWKEVKKVVDKDIENESLGRGGSTIDQQLAKNLYLVTYRSVIRKVLEFTLLPPTEFILSKKRILELYLNVIEWGPGVYGAEAAAEYYYHVPASRLNREQAARLAACIPSPLRRKPNRMNAYSDEILDRMRLMGW